MNRWATLLISFALAGGPAPATEPAGMWLNVPFVAQVKNGCGAASIAMVMQYWHRQQPGQPAIPSADEIQRALYSQQARGIYASELERYLQRYGYRTFAIRGDWTDLRQHLEKGRPLIVALRAGNDDSHYVVVTGMDWQQDLVLKHDPAERPMLKQHRSDFERQWKAAGNWTLLAVPGKAEAPDQERVPDSEPQSPSP